MSESAVEPPVNNGQGVEQQQQVQPTAESESNPYADFYQGLLKDVPDGQKPIVEPYLKQWQSEVGKKFNELHSQIKPLEDFKEFVDAGYSRDDIIQAVNIVQTMNEDPKRIYDALADSLGLTGGQGLEQQQGQVPAEEEVQLEPWQTELTELKESFTQLAQYILGQQEKTAQQQREEELDQELSDLHTKYDKVKGPFDDRYVLTLLAAGVEPDDAVEDFYKTFDAVASQRNAPLAPTVLGSGGGLPVNGGIDPKQLDDKGTRSLVAQILQAAKES